MGHSFAQDVLHPSFTSGEKEVQTRFGEKEKIKTRGIFPYIVGKVGKKRRFIYTSEEPSFKRGRKGEIAPFHEEAPGLSVFSPAAGGRSQFGGKKKGGLVPCLE